MICIDNSSLLQGKSVMIIGASGTIGGELAKGFQQAGARLLLAGRNVEKLNEVAKEYGLVNYSTIQIDLADMTSVRDVFEQMDKGAEQFDVVVNTAGYQVRKSALTINEDEWEKILAINLKAVFFCCQAAARIWCKRKQKGSIINITSLTAEIGINKLAAYAATKGGLKQLSKVLASEWAQFGIRVNCIGPGRISSTMTADVLADDGSVADIMRVIPCARLGTATDLIGVSLLLASELADYITGQDFYVDGGWLAAGGNIQQ